MRNSSKHNTISQYTLGPKGLEAEGWVVLDWTTIQQEMDYYKGEEVLSFCIPNGSTDRVDIPRSELQAYLDNSVADPWGRPVLQDNNNPISEGY